MSGYGKLGQALAIAAVIASSIFLPACSSSANVPAADYTNIPQVIAVVGDFGSGKPAERRVAKMVHAQNPSFVLTVGDNAYNNKGYDKLVKRYYPGPIVAATGNHDYSVGIDNFDQFFGISPFSRTYVYQAKSGVDFFMLDSTAGLASTDVLRSQYAWLSDALAKSKANFKVVVLHHPPYSSSKHGSTKKYQWPFADMGADLVLSGHDHTYERIIRRGGMYVVDGTGGASLYKCKTPIYGSQGCDDKHYGALFLYVNSYQLRAVYRGTNGKILDSFAIDR
jgi:tartrate-resistant acid phosphatase type 5